MRHAIAHLLLAACAAAFTQVAAAAEIGKADRLPPAGLRTHGRYVDFSPADGAAVDRNPPPLTWPWNAPEQKPWEKPGKWAFRLTVSRGGAPADKVLQEKVDFNTFAMLPALEAGAEYTWQVEWLDEKGQVAATGPTRRFTVARNAKVYDLSILRKLPALGHPRYCCLAKDLPTLRQQADANTPFGAAAIAIRDGVKPVIKWGKLADGFSFCPQIQDLACTHMLFGDDKATAMAVEGLVRACRDKMNRPETMPGGDYTGNFHTRSLLTAYDWLYDALTDDQRQLCAKELALRADSMFQAGLVCLQYTAEGRDASHPLELLALGTLGAWVLHEECPELTPQLMEGLNYFLATSGPYGQGLGWTEGRGYGRSHLLYLAQDVLAWPQIALKIPVAEYGRWDELAKFFATLSPVGEDREPFGDGAAYWHKGWGFPVILTAALAGDAQTFQRLTLKGETKRYFSRLGNSSVDYVPEPPPLAYYIPTPPQAKIEPSARLLAPDAGFVIEHTDSLDAAKSVGFIFKCSPMGWTNHCHADQGSFALYAWGQLLACNTGTYQGPGGGYGGPQDQNFNKVTISKNSLLINGRGQARTMAAKEFQGRIVAYHADDKYVYCCGSFADAYGPEAKASGVYRHMLMVRGRYFVIFDDVRLAEPGRVRWLYHMPGECVVDRLDQADTSGASGTTAAYHSGDVKVLLGMAGADIRATASDKAIGADGADYTAQQGAPATHLSFERGEPTRNQQFLAVIVPYRQPATGAATQPASAGSSDARVDVIDERHVRVTCDGRADEIGFGPGDRDTVDYQAIEQEEPAAGK